MAELFANSGENSDNATVPTPRLQGIFIPGIDAPNIQDGFGLITPLGGGLSARQYTQYGVSNIISPQETQLHDLAITPAEGNIFNFEGLIGPQGIPGPPGAPGLIQVITAHKYSFLTAPNSSFLTELPHNIDQINQLGTAVDQLIYTDTYETTSGPASSDETPQSEELEDKNWNVMVSDSDGSNLMSGISTGRLYTSDNYGTTWTERQPAGPVVQQWAAGASDSDGSFLVVAAYNGRLYTSNNSGVTWVETRPFGDVNRFWSNVSVDSDGTHLVVTAKVGGDGEAYTSDDSGASWTPVTPPPEMVNLLWEIIRVEAFTWPTLAQDIGIQQRLDRNFDNP